MHNSHLRHDSIHGLLIGTAIGDALGFAREGLSRRTALRMFGRSAMKFRLIPGLGVYSDDTQMQLLTAQSLLQSVSDWRVYRLVFIKRLAWYPLSLPVGIGRATLLAGLKGWLRFFKIQSGCQSAGNGPGVRAIFLALALHGTEHRLAKWVDDGTRLTHNDPLAVDCCLVLAKLAQIASTTKTTPLDSLEALQQLVAASKDATLREKLQQLQGFLEQQRSPRAVARHFGWQQGISGFIVPTTIAVCYCFLRYPSNFVRAVESAIGLGGDTDSVAALVGGLVGAHVGYAKLPTSLVNRINFGPHDRKWIKQMADRLMYWPHGVDDLHDAPSLSSDPIMQVLRNLCLLPVILLHLCWRLPYWLLTDPRPLHERRQSR